MHERDGQGLSPDQPDAATSARPGAPILAVALPDRLLHDLPRHLLPQGGAVRGVRFQDLAGITLAGPHAPSLVLSCLVARDFDALDLARRLAEAGYRGRYLALVQSLPDPRLIRREVAAQCPGVNFDVIILDGSPPLHAL